MREYGKIKSSFWTNAKIRNLSENARHLLLYIYSCPHGNSIGCFVLPLGYICEDMGWDMERVTKLVRELNSNGFIDRDESTRLIRINSWWEHNSIENLNVAKSAVKTLSMLPKCPLLFEVFQQLRSLGNKFINELSNSFPNPEMEPEPEREQEPEPEMEEEDPAQNSQEAFDKWNILASGIGLPVATRLTEARKAKLKARLRDCGGISGWDAALEKVKSSQFLRGENDRGWKADIDFLLQESSFTKLMEGSYDAKFGGGKPKLTDLERALFSAS